MKLFTVFVSFAPPPRDVIVVIIPYKEEAEQMKLFVCFVSFAPPLPPILTHIVTHEEKNTILVFDRGKQKFTQKSTFPV